MINHTTLKDLLENRCGELMDEGPGIGGRIDPGCFSQEVANCGATFAAMMGSEDQPPLPRTEPFRTRELQTRAAAEIARGFVTGVALGLAIAEHEAQEGTDMALDHAYEGRGVPLHAPFGRGETIAGAFKVLWRSGEQAILDNGERDSPATRWLINDASRLEVA